MASLWLVDPKTLKLPKGAKRTIGRKPLIDLAALQLAIKDGVLGDDDVWLATRKCDTDVQKLQWSVPDLLDCISCLQPDDHHGAEWCKSSKGQDRKSTRLNSSH